MNHRIFAKTGGSSVALLMFLHPHAAASQTYDGVTAAIDSGNYSLALNRLDPFLRAGCRGRAYFLLGVVRAKLEDAVATARAADQSLRCRQPALEPRFRDDALDLLRWASRNTSVRVVRAKYELSDDDAPTTDGSLLTAELQQLEQLEKDREVVLALARTHIPEIGAELARAERAQDDLVLPEGVLLDEEPPSDRTTQDRTTSESLQPKL